MDPLGMYSWRYRTMNRQFLSHPQLILALKASCPQLVDMALSKPEQPTAAKAGF